MKKQGDLIFRTIRMPAFPSDFHATLPEVKRQRAFVVLIAAAAKDRESRLLHPAFNFLPDLPSQPTMLKIGYQIEGVDADRRPGPSRTGFSQHKITSVLPFLAKQHDLICRIRDQPPEFFRVPGFVKLQEFLRSINSRIGFPATPGVSALPAGPPPGVSFDHDHASICSRICSASLSTLMRAGSVQSTGISVPIAKRRYPRCAILCSKTSKLSVFTSVGAPTSGYRSFTTWPRCRVGD